MGREAAFNSRRKAMKRLTYVLLVLALVLPLATACGPTPTPTPVPPTAVPPTAIPPTKAPAAPTAAPAAPTTAPAAPTVSTANFKKLLSIATATVGGSYYPIGVGMADVIKKFVPDSDVSVIVTGGGAENPKLVGSGENDLGLSNSQYIYQAYNGLSGYQKYPDLRVLFTSIAPGAIQCAVKADSAIQTWADLKGKKVAVGPSGGGSAPNLTAILDIYGVKFEDIQPSYLGYDDGFTALQNGQVDAAMNTSPLPTASVTTLKASGFKFRLLTMPVDKQQAIIAKYPYYNPLTITKDVYGLDTDAVVIATTNMAIVNAKVPDQQVYLIVKAIFEHIDVVAASHPSAKSIVLPAAAQGSPIPLAAGAEKYFREVGAIK
jgi:uncharacterized protein